MGPWLVTLDEVPDPDDLALGCSVDGETVQDARTADLIFSVPRLIAHDAYAVARHRDGRAVLDDPRTFCSGPGVGLHDFINTVGRGATGDFAQVLPAT